MAKPARLQLSRARGFDLQALSRATNGLPAVNVARPTKWGNPWRVGEKYCPTAAEAVRMFKARLTGPYALPMPPESYMGRIAADIGELRDKNLACWCKPGEPCHADVLLDIANPTDTPTEGE